tara:strand:- start:206 stop:511 length:306 start_codon:yes stop_codon:yes gene_type:complete
MEKEKNDSENEDVLRVGDLVKYTGWRPKVKTGVPWFVDCASQDVYDGLIGVIVAELPYDVNLFVEYGIPETFFGKWFIVLWNDGSQEPFTSEDLELFSEKT